MSEHTLSLHQEYAVQAVLLWQRGDLREWSEVLTRAGITRAEHTALYWLVARMTVEAEVRRIVAEVVS
jgi:hypothetical protein